MPVAEAPASTAFNLSQPTVSFWKPVVNLSITVGLTVISFALFGLLWREQGFELLIVGMGWGHVILGFVFFFGRVVRDQPGARRAFLVLSCATLLLWTVHYSINITFLIYAYFLFHSFRDEVFIYFQTVEGPQSKYNFYSLRGLIPLLLLLLIVTQPQDYRQDLRRVELNSSGMHPDGWTLFSFRPVPESAGRSFYFYLQAPNSRDKHGFSVSALTESRVTDGGLRIGDWRTTDAQDLVFYPQFENEAGDPAQFREAEAVTIDLELGDNNRIGQTFVADRSNMTGIWLRTHISEAAQDDVRFLFRLATPPLLPLEPPFSTVRTVMIWLLVAVFLWQVVPGFWNNRKVWLYLAIFAALLVLSQQFLKPAGRLGYIVPMIFQVIVVFHYFSWYVFSYGKFNRIRQVKNPVVAVKGVYDKFLANLRNPVYFTVMMLGLNLISFAGAFWYYLGSGPDVLKYAFNYNYFLYFLVFHVTFSFSPKT